MSATDSSAESGRKYKPLPAPKTQKNFGTRRRTKRATLPVPTLPKKQSTLTQNGFELPSPSVVDVVSDEEESDMYEDRPAKRQRTSAKGTKAKNSKLGREKGQASFTQNNFIDRMSRLKRIDLDSQGFQIWQDSDAEDDLGSSSPAPHGRPSPRLDGGGDDEEQVRSLEIPESSQTTVRVDHLDIPGGLETAPELAPQRTPQKVRFVEIPRSHTPRSTRASTRRSGYSSRRQPSVSRSPLKEQNVNAQSPLKSHPSPETQNLSLKMLERVRFANQQRARRARREAEQPIDEDLEQCAEEATDEFSLHTYAMPPPPPPHPRLQRKMTVQDSQADDLSESVKSTLDHAPRKLLRTNTIADSQRDSSNETLVEDSGARRPTRTLTRVTTIQDSEDEDLDVDFDDRIGFDAGSMTQNTRSGRGMDDDLEDDDDFGEGTYDPAYSALDRDASRFGWTQTQKRSQEIEQSDRMEDEDLDRGYSTTTPRSGVPLNAAEPPNGGQPFGSRPVSVKDEHGPPDEVPPDPGAAVRKTEALALLDDSAYESGDQTAGAGSVQVPSSPPALHPVVEAEETSEDIHVPSSPPPLRPSQVSTVVPTQMSVARQPYSPETQIKAELFSQIPTPRRRTQAFSMLDSPQRPNSLWQADDSVSSSPMPLPPWSSPEKHRPNRASRQAEGSVDFSSDALLDSVADFSLPPPPPLSSSRRGTPASSSL